MLAYLEQLAAAPASTLEALSERWRFDDRPAMPSRGDGMLTHSIEEATRCLCLSLAVGNTNAGDVGLEHILSAASSLTDQLRKAEPRNLFAAEARFLSGPSKIGITALDRLHLSNALLAGALICRGAINRLTF
ncbi:hypothetical protein [Azospirillum sp. SYSU D00513]|uniref:hypothetical protein n=1 Tax=Azospirillum sp. SYSU D00513 TaxID=2812561 RepID=UPI001A9683B2|nr:hypothetical protein [Azospirillum sp. SYSU D00513]